MSEELEILIVSRTEAGEILSSPRRCAELALLVSIGDPDARTPAGFGKVARRLRLIFQDTLDDMGASERDVQRIIDLSRRIDAKHGKVLVHCEAGISRSSAAALIMYAVVLGAGREAEAYARVMEQRPIAMPNGRMIAIADGLLGREGALSRVLRQSPN